MPATDSDDLAARFERMEALLTVIAKVSMAPVLAEELKDDRMARLYEMTGSATVQTATKALGCSATTVSDAWKRWESLGIVRKTGKRYERVF